MARIALNYVEKVYGGGVKALDELNLEVRGRVYGARRVLRGAASRSRCGRSQGLEITGGTISIGGSYGMSRRPRRARSHD